jgi:hypothetical protein
MSTDADLSWDLDALIDLEAAGIGGDGAGGGEEAVTALLDAASERSEKFAERL